MVKIINLIPLNFSCHVEISLNICVNHLDSLIMSKILIFNQIYIKIFSFMMSNESLNIIKIILG